MACVGSQRISDKDADICFLVLRKLFYRPFDDHLGFVARPHHNRREGGKDDVFLFHSLLYVINVSSLQM